MANQTSKEKSSVLTLRLGSSDCASMEQIKAKHHISASSKATQFMLRNFLNMEEEIKNLRNEKALLQREINEFRTSWKEFRYSMNRLDKLSDSK